jgi:hypothetical protein
LDTLSHKIAYGIKVENKWHDYSFIFIWITDTFRLVNNVAKYFRYEKVLMEY